MIIVSIVVVVIDFSLEGLGASIDYGCDGEDGDVDDDDVNNDDDHHHRTT